MIIRLAALAFALAISVASARAAPPPGEPFGNVIWIMISDVPKVEQARINGAYPVSNKGAVRLWQIGNVEVTGLTPASLAKGIETAYRDAKIYADPKIWINGIASDGSKADFVSIGGKVKFPNLTWELEPGMTLLQVVTAAGGPTNEAVMNQVRLYRDGKVHPCDLTKKAHQDLEIRPGDAIDVPGNQAKGPE